MVGMDSDQRQRLEHHAGNRLEENNVSLVFKCVKCFWSLIFLPFILVRGILYYVGKKVDIRTGVAIIAVLGLIISGIVSKSGPLANLESKNITSSLGVLQMNDETRLGMFSQSEHEGYGNVSHMNMLRSVTQNVVPTECFFWQSRKLDSEDLGTCPCSIPGLVPALSKWKKTSNGFIVVSLLSGIQWISMEEQEILTFDSENSSLLNPFEKCQDSGALFSSVQAYEPTAEPHNCEIKPEANLIQRAVDSGENSEEKNNLQSVSNIMNSLRNNIWSFLALLVLSLDGMIWQTLDIIIGFLVIIFLGLGIPEIVESGLLGSPISWFEFPLLMYLIAYFLMLLLLILKCISRIEWLSCYMAGAAYSSATLGILSFILSSLSSEYARVCVPILGVLLVLAVFCGYNPNAADQRRLGD